MKDMERIVMTGATGLIGSRLYRSLRAEGYGITVLARNVEKASVLFPDAEQVLFWAPGVAGAWKSAMDGAQAVIHLAAESLAAERWSEAYKKRVRDSRILGTLGLVSAFGTAKTPPSVFISSTAIGYYGDTGDDAVDEGSPPGPDFLARLCVDWEAAALGAEACGVRVVTPRTGLVLAAEGGALPKLIAPFRMFVGGPVGSGRQWFPWIHIDDVVGIYMHALRHPGLAGAVNAVAPGVIRNRDFAAALGEALNRPSLFAVPAFMLKLAVGEISEALLGGQKAEPKRALESGYSFTYPDIHGALADLVAKKP